MLGYLRPMLEPIAHDHFKFTREWMRAQAARIADPRNAAAQVGRQLNLPPSYLLIHRVTLGSIGVLCQFDAALPTAVSSNAGNPASPPPDPHHVAAGCPEPAATTRCGPPEWRRRRGTAAEKAAEPLAHSEARSRGRRDRAVGRVGS